MPDAPLLPFLTPPIRAWLYRVTVAAAPLATIYGIVTEQTAGLWVGLAAAVLGTGTAAAHTPRR